MKTIRQRSLRSVLAIGACALAAGAATAQTNNAAETIVPETARADRAALGPEIQREGDISYVTGGVSDAGKAETLALGRAMNLQLVFAQAPSGQYVADIDVAVAERGGDTVLELQSADPLLLAKLPPGDYVVTATSADGRSIRRSFEVPAQGRHTEYFHWRGAEQLASAAR
jgi:hypothetical protein